MKKKVINFLNFDLEARNLFYNSPRILHFMKIYEKNYNLKLNILYFDIIIKNNNNRKKMFDLFFHFNDVNLKIKNIQRNEYFRFLNLIKKYYLYFEVFNTCYNFDRKVKMQSIIKRGTQYNEFGISLLVDAFDKNIDLSKKENNYFFIISFMADWYGIIDKSYSDLVAIFFKKFDEIKIIVVKFLKYFVNDEKKEEDWNHLQEELKTIKNSWNIVKYFLEFNKRYILLDLTSKNYLKNYKTNFLITLKNKALGFQIIIMLFRRIDLINIANLKGNFFDDKIEDSYISNIKLFVKYMNEFFEDEENLSLFFIKSKFKNLDKLMNKRDKVELSALKLGFKISVLKCKLKYSKLNDETIVNKIRIMEERKKKKEQIWDKLFIKYYWLWDDCNTGEFHILKNKFKKIWILFLRGNIKEEWLDDNIIMNYKKREENWVFLRSFFEKSFMLQYNGYTFLGILENLQDDWIKNRFPSILKEKNYVNIISSKKNYEDFIKDWGYSGWNKNTEKMYSIYGLFLKFVGEVLFDFFNTKVAKYFISLDYLINKYSFYKKTLQINFNLNGLLPCNTKENTVLYSYKIKMIDNQGLIKKYQPKFIPKIETRFYQDWYEASQEYLDENLEKISETFIGINKLSKKTFDFYSFILKKEKIKEYNSFIAIMTKSFHELIVLALIEECFKKNIKFYHIFYCFIINEADYFDFMSCYKKVFKQIFFNSNQFLDFVDSVYNEIKDELKEEERKEFIRLHEDICKEMCDKKKWDEDIWQHIEKNVYILRF